MQFARRLRWIGLAALSVWGVSAAAAPPEARPAPTPDPLAGTVDGVSAADWTRVGEARSFDAENLWEFIDGDAERFVDAGVERMRTAEFRFKQRLDATAEVYRMKDADGAGRILQSESASGTQAVEVGDAGRLHETGLTFRLGRHFVRLSAFEAAPETKEALLALGRALAARLEEK
jgi:hypothetical protein